MSIISSSLLSAFDAGVGRDGLAARVTGVLAPRQLPTCEDGAGTEGEKRRLPGAEFGVVGVCETIGGAHDQDVAVPEEGEAAAPVGVQDCVRGGRMRGSQHQE